MAERKDGKGYSLMCHRLCKSIRQGKSKEIFELFACLFCLFKDTSTPYVLSDAEIYFYIIKMWYVILLSQ